MECLNLLCQSPTLDRKGRSEREEREKKEKREKERERERDKKEREKWFIKNRVNEKSVWKIMK